MGRPARGAPPPARRARRNQPTLVRQAVEGIGIVVLMGLATTLVGYGISLAVSLLF